MNEALASNRTGTEAMIGSVAAGPFATGLLVVSLTAIVAGVAVAPSLAIAMAVCGLADLLPIAMACVLRSRQSFALAWLAAALLRLPVAFLLASLFQGRSEVTDALPFVYLLSLLLSVAVATLILRAHEEAAAR